MNKLLEKAFAKAAELPEDQQKAIAERMLVEVEQSWDERFAKTQDRLSDLLRRAGEHIARGTTQPYDSSDRPSK